jgi:hypothetical protein
VRDIWYGDNRDIVKWGTLLHIARAHSIGLVVQIAFLRPSDLGGLESDSREIPIPGEVWEHFRDLHNIQGLATRAGVEIRVLDAQFEQHGRSPFVSGVVSDLEALPARKVVLLDPDTGIAPKKYDAKHVTADEIAMVWAALGPGDWLVHYQHRRHTISWLDETREEFRAAVSGQTVHTFRGPKVAPDVAFFAAPK